MKKSLEELIFPLTKDEFIKNYLSNIPVVSHGLNELVDYFKELPFLSSLDDLIRIWPTSVHAYKEGIADEINSQEVSPIEAKRLFSEGKGLLFNDPNEISPEIAEWLEIIKQDLGLSNLTYGRSLIYAIAEGHGTEAHFDQNINFVLQISGTKKWWIAPNYEIENPLTRHTLGTQMDPELASYWRDNHIDTFPENATEYELTPGTLLFVPRGCWHKTYATSDALSLNFTYSAPSWIDLLSCALRARLAQSKEWRSTANFVTDKKRFQQSIEEFDELLNSLASDVSNWNAKDILQATEMDRFPTEDQTQEKI